MDVARFKHHLAGDPSFTTYLKAQVYFLGAGAVVFLSASLSALGTGTGTASGTGTGAALAAAGFACFAANFACLLPSPYMVITIMTLTVVMAITIQRVGFSIKNKAHFGFIMPTTKKSNVNKPKFMACNNSVCWDIFYPD
jgi:hypothetical protein